MARAASPDQIRSRFRALARERHPDRFLGAARDQAERDFQAITEAFNVLSSHHLRRQHDQELSRVATPGGPDESTRMIKFQLEAGVGFYRDGNFFAAAECFERVLRIDPRHHQAWNNLAQALGHQRKFLDRALEASVRACELEPMNSTYLKLAGRLHSEAGLLEKAERYYNEALAWGGDDDVVVRALEELRTSRKGRNSRPGRSS